VGNQNVTAPQVKLHHRRVGSNQHNQPKLCFGIKARKGLKAVDAKAAVPKFFKPKLKRKQPPSKSGRKSEMMPTERKAKKPRFGNRTGIKKGGSKGGLLNFFQPVKSVSVRKQPCDGGKAQLETPLQHVNITSPPVVLNEDSWKECGRSKAPAETKAKLKASASLSGTRSSRKPLGSHVKHVSKLRLEDVEMPVPAGLGKAASDIKTNGKKVFGRKRSSPENSSLPLPPRKKRVFGRREKQLAEMDTKQRFGKKASGKWNVANELSTPINNVASKASSSSSERGTHYRRLLVLQLAEDSEKQLLTHDEITGEQVHVVLRGRWVETDVRPGDIVHIIGEPEDADTKQKYLVNEDKNFIIVLPDCLIIPTCIASSFPCLRAAVLSKKLRNGEQNKAMLIGTMAHEIFQLSLQRGRFETKWIEKDLEWALQEHVLDLYLVDMKKEDGRDKLNEFVGNMVKFGEKYWKDKFSPNEMNLVKHVS